MSEIKDEAQLGYLIAQDHGFAKQKILLDKRGKIVFVRVRKRRIDEGDDVSWEIFEEATGDWIGLTNWAKATREISGWMDSWPSQLVAASSGAGGSGASTASALPIFNSQWLNDDRFASMLVSPPPDTGNVPAGTYGITMGGTREDRQETVFFPIDRRLIAVNHAGDPSMGSLVADLTAENKIDPERLASLQSAMRVIKLPTGIIPFADGQNALALQLGQTGRDDTEGFGMMVEKLGITTRIAIAGRIGHGPFHVGRNRDKHKIGVDADGHDINSMHLWTKFIYFHEELLAGGLLPIRTDGPQEYNNMLYSNPAPAPYRVRVHRNYDPSLPYGWLGQLLRGQLRLEAESFIYVPGDVDDPPTVPTESGENGKIVPEPGEGGLDDAIYGGRDTVNPFKALDRTKGAEETYPAMNQIIALHGAIGRGLLVYTPDSKDIRTSQQPPIDAVRLTDAKSPVVWRSEFFPCYTTDIAINYTQRPGQGRYKFGSGPGVKVNMPPELDAADILNDFSPTDVTQSTVSEVNLPGVRTGWGGVSILNGLCGVKNGHDIEAQGDGTTDITAVDSSGVRTRIGTLQQSAISEQIVPAGQDFLSPAQMNPLAYDPADISNGMAVQYTDGVDQIRAWPLIAGARSWMEAADSQLKIVVKMASDQTGDLSLILFLLVKTCGGTVYPAAVQPEAVADTVTIGTANEWNCVAYYVDQSVLSPGDSMFFGIARNGSDAPTDTNTGTMKVDIPGITAQWVTDDNADDFSAGFFIPPP